MSELKPCPFCGGEAVIYCSGSPSNGSFMEVICRKCHCQTFRLRGDEAIEAWNRRAAAVKAETNIYDKEEIFPDCTVQVLTNTATGETSVGWWKNG